MAILTSPLTATLSAQAVAQAFGGQVNWLFRALQREALGMTCLIQSCPLKRLAWVVSGRATGRAAWHR